MNDILKPRMVGPSLSERLSVMPAVVVTGARQTGKTSLAMDTIYAEGQRRYVESLSAYARQFLELMQKPDKPKRKIGFHP